jgi:thiamine-phosphate pyrophosphorylase
MTDERVGDALWDALERLPAGSGVVFRHHATPPSERRRLYERVRRIARRRRLVLLLAGPPSLAVAWRADGAHGRSPHRRAPRPLLRSAPCHDRRELVAAHRAGIRFVSPIHPTRSHPGARTLGVRAGLLIAGERRGLVALGGMDDRRYRAVRPMGFDGWAAIDAWCV